MYVYARSECAVTVFVVTICGDSGGRGGGGLARGERLVVRKRRVTRDVNATKAPLLNAGRIEVSGFDARRN